MNRILQPITDFVSTRKGMWLTLIAWVVLSVLLSAGPPASEYRSASFQSLPDDAQSIIAENKVKELFPDDQATPGILVFNAQEEIQASDVQAVLDEIREAELTGVQEMMDLSVLPPQALEGFFSEDSRTFIFPIELEPGIGNDKYSEINDEILSIGQTYGEEQDAFDFYVTGPAGIAGDTLKLFEEADFVLLLATIGIILVLLILIYRSPLLAVIPLLATAIVYQVTNQMIGLLGAGGLEINNATTSIMSILLFAAVTDYSLFVFSRFKEELYQYENKHTAMAVAMRATGKPVFFAGATVLAAMLVLFMADFRDYQNFAPVFSTALVVIILASVTLVPALFTLFGRKAFWPKVPHYGKQPKEEKGLWTRIAELVTRRPYVSGGAVLVLLIVASLNLFNLEYEFDMVKSFPENLPSRSGYEIVESNFDKGRLAPMTVVLEGEDGLNEEVRTSFEEFLANEDAVASFRPANETEDGSAVSYSVTLSLNPYTTEAMDAVDAMRAETSEYDDAAVYWSGMTPKLVDEQNINNQDIIRIVIAETILIIVLLFFMTRSWKMPLYMMATILLSFTAALGIGIFAVDVLFGYEAISTRVPLYAFIFLVALGIDYNIILVSRFLEERQKLAIKPALKRSIASTGGVISSAGVILAATFAALMTMPIADLFVFGFIVAIGILIDTFLVRGVLLPALILFFEKDKTTKA
ncbi:MMPL family transporter [Jeotgalibacillus haloalkalitolerans]|uniref:MMPL family transporter n=1 Tax=Jeotgalibacillus haloalkalitolerans TaxID=3104292 RepID=A0ABU5KPK7_9BACL|nr:MMPL family transporter [Jeotgalibacillus sp. HH7-29]MDZ5712666.1 MMPL family transporter [Jeotgalibacillus sp. HH7-29]